MTEGNKLKVVCFMNDCINCDRKKNTCKLDKIMVDMGMFDNNSCCVSYQKDGQPSIADCIYGAQKIDFYKTAYA